MRFELSKVLDTIEQHLTTDPVLAQAVVDLDEVARHTTLDRGRGINLIRIGMVVDALCRYLRDGGAYVYAVAPRKMLSEAELTSKERMVLGRWTDAGLIEATPDAVARVPEIAELTGLPIVSTQAYGALAGRHGFLAGNPLRVLTVAAHLGGALLTDGSGGTGGVLVPTEAELDELTHARVISTPPAPVVGRATPKDKIDPPAEPAAAGEGERAADAARPESNRPKVSLAERSLWPDPKRVYVKPLPLPPVIRVAPSQTGAQLMTRIWHCDGFDCPSFGDLRRTGQPVPLLRKGSPVCPKHDDPLTDIGPRPMEIAVALLIDGLRQRRFPVIQGQPVVVGRKPEDDEAVSVEPWLHDAAQAWISPKHLRIDVADGKLQLECLGYNGTLLWLRSEPDSRPQTRRLARGQTYPLGEWDSAELYTGIELCYADRRPVGVDASPAYPVSVLADAPTMVMFLPKDE